MGNVVSFPTPKKESPPIEFRVGAETYANNRRYIGIVDINGRIVDGGILFKFVDNKLYRANDVSPELGLELDENGCVVVH